MKFTRGRIIAMILTAILSTVSFLLMYNDYSFGGFVVMIIGILIIIFATMDCEKKSEQYFFWLVPILVGLVLSIIISPSNSSHSSSSQGYYDSKGYYHPTDDEMEKVRDEVNDWMDSNW